MPYAALPCSACKERPALPAEVVCLACHMVLFPDWDIRFLPPKTRTRTPKVGVRGEWGGEVLRPCRKVVYKPN